MSHLCVQTASCLSNHVSDSCCFTVHEFDYSSPIPAVSQCTSLIISASWQFSRKSHQVYLAKGYDRPMQSQAFACFAHCKPQLITFYLQKSPEFSAHPEDICFLLVLFGVCLVIFGYFDDSFGYVWVLVIVGVLFLFLMMLTIFW